MRKREREWEEERECSDESDESDVREEQTPVHTDSGHEILYHQDEKLQNRTVKVSGSSCAKHDTFCVGNDAFNPPP